VIGLEVDEAVDLVALPESTAFPSVDIGVAGGLVTGFVEHNGHLLRILDMERLLTGGDQERAPEASKGTDA
jgi:chemotaxis signal transduction protein